MAGREARRDGPARRRPRAAALLRQGGGHAVRPLPRRRLGARPGDEVDRRGHGRRRSTSRPPTRSRSSPSTTRCPRRGTAFVSVCDRDKRADRRRCVKHLHDARLLDHVDARYRQGAARGGHPGDRGAQEARGPSQRHRPHRQRRGPARHQHAVRPGDALGRLPPPRGRHPARHHQHHDAPGRHGDRAGHRGGQGRPARRPRAAGLRRVGRR